jgi:hypothetical protein
MTKKNIVLLIVLAVLVSVGFYYASKPTSTLRGAYSDFAIQDTAAIQKIHIADLLGNSIILERQPKGSWKLNEKYFARDYAVKLLLETFNRLKVQGPVPEKMKPRVFKRLAARHSLVEVFTDDLEKPTKTYYVGDATMNHMGTFMLLETPNGKSTTPYIVEDISTKGFLTPRFHTRIDEWRNTTLFQYPNLDIKRIEVEFFDEPSNSFSLAYNGNNDISIYDYQLKKLENINIQAAKEYLVNYKKVNFESYVESNISHLKIDSITSHTPNYEIRLFPQTGENEFITLWKKDVGIEKEDRFGYIVNYDVDRMWGKTHLNNFVFAQYYTFDRLLVPVSYFQKN